ncbi:MAG TPA: dihydroorotase [Flavobacteriales bacterium]|nr:dihydroorotase [Flavobacteriales bacterium]
MARILIKNGLVVNQGKIQEQNIVLENEFIASVGGTSEGNFDEIVDAKGCFVLPGLIDDQVHFREPGLTHKADIYSESRAAVAGGITSFMEMPNTVPNTLTQALLEDKYKIAAEKSLANYSFFMGAGNDNLEEVLKTDPKNVCGIKIFMGSSTGNMLVDNIATLEAIFKNSPCLIATHCEDEATIKANTEKFKREFGDNLDAAHHPLIRSAEACYISSSMAIELAKKYNTRLHILHISTAKETTLFRNDIPLKEKRITAEACIHHLWFTDKDYTEKGNFIKWNPAVKTQEDREGVWKALLDGRIDVIATDHAPHTIEEKNKKYTEAPSGGPLVQHALLALMEFHRQGKISIEDIVQKASHNVADLFNIHKRGYLKQGYYGDIVVIDPKKPQTVNKENILYKCGWSPFEGTTFSSTVKHTFISGHHAYADGKFNEGKSGLRMQFDR